MYDGVGIKGKTEAFAKILAQRSDTKTYVSMRMSKGQFDHILDMSDAEGIDAVKRMIEMSSAEFIKQFNCFLDGYDNMSIAAESVYAYIVGKSVHSFIKAIMTGKKMNVADYGISNNGIKRLLSLCQAPFDIAAVMELKDGFWVPYTEITSDLKANIKTLFSDDNGVYNAFKVVQKPEWLVENTVVEWLLYCGMTNNLAFTVGKPLFTGFNEDNYDKVVELKEAYEIKLNNQSAAIWKEVKYLSKKRNQEKAAAEALAKQKELLTDFGKW